MNIQCWYCHKSVSTELPDDFFFRAIAVCPECVEASPEAENHPLEQTSQQKDMLDKEISGDLNR